ncbi:MAG: CoA pyrophosphatase [Tissierellia bacterium]|nr:CoA pyrophosphatase [Tissierellia bacterium]
MDIEYIKNKVHNRTPKPMDVKYRYAILVPIINNNNKLELIFQMRAKTLNRQPGEISFPGGQLEKDESFKEAAIRETVEELNILEENISIIGELDYIVSYYNSTVHAFLGTIDGVNIDEINPNKAEVDHIFTVPLDFFLENEPEIYHLDLLIQNSSEFPYNLIPNGEDYNWGRGKHIVHFYHYKDYIIWGYTAKVVKHLTDIIKSH